MRACASKCQMPATATRSCKTPRKAWAGGFKSGMMVTDTNN